MPSNYFKDIADGIRTTAKGMALTMRHLWAARKRRMPGDVRNDSFFAQADGMVTIQYPFETIPIPDNGRYRLHNEMDDCIVCDKCAKVCPVDCIDIEPIRAIEEVGKASDGSPIRLYAAKFDIDMAKCCYCGLCTTVCPTECLTMTKTFDYSEFDVRDMVYEYGNLTTAEAEEKKRLLEQFQKEKEELKAAAKAQPTIKSEEVAPADKPRPAFRPGIKPTPAPPAETEAKSEEATPAEKPKPAFRPGMKPKATPPAETEAKNEEATTAEKPKPAFRPNMKPKATPPAETEAKSEEVAPAEKPKPAFKPSMKPKATPPVEPEAISEEATPTEKPKPAFKPSMKPKPAFRPSMKPKATPPTETEAKSEDSISAEKPKPAFKPTMKPKPPKNE